MREGIFLIFDLEKIKELVPIGDCIGQYVVLKGHGKILTGLCPFHAERTPSFKVYQNGSYRCYGCGAHGDVIEFVKEYFQLGFKESIVRLCKEWDIPIFTVIKHQDYSDSTTVYSPLKKADFELLGLNNVEMVKLYRTNPEQYKERLQETILILELRIEKMKRITGDIKILDEIYQEYQLIVQKGLHC